MWGRLFFACHVTSFHRYIQLGLGVWSFLYRLYHQGNRFVIMEGGVMYGANNIKPGNRSYMVLVYAQSVIDAPTHCWLFWFCCFWPNFNLFLITEVLEQNHRIYFQGIDYCIQGQVHVIDIVIEASLLGINPGYNVSNHYSINSRHDTKLLHCDKSNKWAFLYRIHCYIIRLGMNSLSRVNSSSRTLHQNHRIYFCWPKTI